MASELWKNAFENLKLSVIDRSPANFKNDGKPMDSVPTDYTSHNRAEMLEYKRNSKTISEKYHIQEGKAFSPDLKCSGYVYKKPPISDDSYHCKSQRHKKSREKIKLSPSKMDTMEIKKTEKNCKETLPVEKEMIDQKAEVSNEGNEKSEISADPEKKKPYNHSSDHCYNPTKSLNKKKNCKKIITPEERKLLKILEESGRFRRVKASEREVNEDCNSKNIGACMYQTSALADSNVSESNLRLNDVDYENNLSSIGCISALRYTQADRMASPSIILSEIWDIEEDW